MLPQSVGHRERRAANLDEIASYGKKRKPDTEDAGMSEGDLETKSAAPPPASNRRGTGRLTKWLLWTGGVLLSLVCVAAGTLAILLHRAAPILRASLIDTLQKRFHAKVELDDLNASILDGFWVEGRGLRIWLPQEVIGQAGSEARTEPWMTQPWILVDRLKFHASWRMLPGKPIEVSVIHVEGVRVLLPPREDRPHMSLSGIGSDSASAPPAKPTSSSSLFKMPQIRVHKVECDQAQLVIERKLEAGKPARTPLDFDLKKIILTPDGKGGPIAFSVDMINAKPIGAIHSTGHVGPWTPGDPGEIPVDGDYSFDHADLSTVKGIAGILSSTGHYAGTLRKIEADGQTQTPDFRLERVHKESGEMLRTRFHAIVDGTNGNTQLQPVDAMLGRTHIVAKGDVVRAEDAGTGNGAPGAHGHDITLDVTIDRGRIDDILAIATDSEKPFVIGNLTLHTKFHLPPNPKDQQISVIDRLEMDGLFHLSQALFNNATMQGKIAQLSLRGQGKTEDIKSTDPATILSDAQGHFTLAKGSLQLPDLTYRVPGAKILAHGNYGLQGGTLSFEGDADLDAELSAVVGGWKGILLKPVDHYLKKNGAGTDVPIHIQGTRHDPKFGVDFDRLGKTEESPQPAPQ
jgi:hypothetical protein